MPESPDSEAAPYDLLLTLDELESLREEMDELGAATAGDLADLGTPAALALLAELAALDLDSVAALTERIMALHQQLDRLEADA
jgi:hypothetical protein